MAGLKRKHATKKKSKPRIPANGHLDPFKRPDIDINSYIPSVSKETGEWIISETDLDFLADGCGVLGTGTECISLLGTIYNIL